MSLEKFRKDAVEIARVLGCKSFCTELAEHDFRTYLESDLINPYYPQWGSKLEWLRLAKEMSSQSGHGNPLSPIYFVGSELSADIQAYQELYFKFCFDLLWREYFNCARCSLFNAHIRRAFIKYWGGAGVEDKILGYYNARFYRTLRHTVMSNPALWQEQSFVDNHIEWHSNGNRKDGHYFGKTSALLRLIFLFPFGLANKQAACLSCYTHPNALFPGFGQQTSIKSKLSDYTIDDLAFFTESSLVTASAGAKGTGDGKLNQFFSYALEHFVQKRIFIFSPTQKKIIYKNKEIHRQKAVRDTLDEQCRIVEQHPGNNNYAITVYRHYRGHFAIVVHSNLSQSAVNSSQLVLLRCLVQKYARKI